MRTVGVDLSAMTAATAAVALEWDGGRGSDGGSPPAVGLDDEAIVWWLGGADRASIDAPFGWPDAFRAQIERWSETSAWPAVPRRALRFRRTDELCAERGRLPLSVSSDRIASTAMRCAEVLARLNADAPVDRVDGKVVESYPAVALVVWGIPVTGYKKRDATAQRRDMSTLLATRARLDLSRETIDACAATDHALDALVCALVARAVDRRLTHRPAPSDSAQIGREGWIHVPCPGTLERLAG